MSRDPAKMRVRRSYLARDMGAKGQSDWELSFLNKLRLRVLLFFGRCPDCGGKLWTWSYGKYKCDRCQETFPA